ncbi:MAG: DUF2461 domain-containing protein [Deltaproteobacteria bacterium]|jgi:uncharacterized protein (TIGR02453 family)|nr:DUF2461 domain-containing protein [Deltaproteobacteria bacterium]
MSSFKLSTRTLELLALLGASYDRDFYHSHRDEIETYIIEPARYLVIEVGERLRKVFPDLVVEPKVDRSIYRLYRDVRFSPDKHPYKGHLGLIWWDGKIAGKLQSPSFYFHLTAEGWLWSTGVYSFSPAALAAWRRALLDQKTGAEFLKIASKMAGLGLSFSQPELKRSPTGFDNPKTENWARYKGLYTWMDLNEHDKKLFGPKAASLIVDHFLSTESLYRYLRRLYDDRRPNEEIPASIKPKTAAVKRNTSYQYDF